MAAFDGQQWGEALEQYFEAIYHDKMQGLPIVNSNMQVRLACLKAVREGVYLGALVTPWFINLLLKMVQQNESDVRDRHLEFYPEIGVGEKVVMKFPSGQYEMLVNHQPTLGYFYTCALFSDMHSIENQAVAEEVAQQCVHLVFDEAAKAPNLFRPVQNDVLMNEQHTKNAQKTEKMPKSPVPQVQTASRRDFLRLNRVDKV